MLPDAAPQDAFERLRGLPFVELSSDGLVLHDTVREVVAAYLRSSDPDRSRRYRIAAWRQLRDEVTRASPHEMWRYTADLLFILAEPGRPRGVLPDAPSTCYFVEPRQPEDWPAIACDRSRVPSRPSPSRSSRTGGAGCPTPSGRPATAPGASPDSRAAMPDRSESRERCSTPTRSPGSGGTTSAVARCRAASGSSSSGLHGAPRGSGNALVVAALMLDLKRIYMELRPELRRIYNMPSRAIRTRSPWTTLASRASRAPRSRSTASRTSARLCSTSGRRPSTAG